MNKLLLIIILATFVGCQKESSQRNSEYDNPSTNAITPEMGCENCRMNLIKYIKTGHAIQTEDGENQYYCSINCCTTALNRNNYSNASVFAIDKQSVNYVPADSIYYVIGSKYPAVMSKVSKYAFKDSTLAEQFKLEQEGDTILRYKDVVKMCEEEIARR
jgi:nitrous oxide reductase accessory protein NosL